MKNGFIHHNSFKKCLCRSQLCVMCCGLVCIFLLVYIYNNFQSNSELIYQHSEEFFQENFRGDDDIVSKLERVYSKTEQKDKPGDVNENKISSQKDNKQQKAQPDQLKNINQQKVVKLPDKPGDMIENKPSQKENSQQKANSKPDQGNQNVDLGINATHVNGILMEPVNVDYTRNIYFTVKTTHHYYTKRLLTLMLTWLQVVDKNKLSIITDSSAPKNNYVDVFRKAGYQIEVNGLCWDSHSRWGLCCKMGTEFATYYKVVQQHPNETDKYQWFCHSDDDVYINVPKLSRLLQQYDPHKPYYVGKWPQSYYKDPYYRLDNKTVYQFSHDRHLPLKRRTFQYATGSSFCISYAMMMEVKKFLNGANSLNKMSLSATPRLADDMTVGFVIGALLGHNLTDVADMTNEFDAYVRNSSLNVLTRYLTISSAITVNAGSLVKLSSSLKTPLPSGDPTRFLLYHCLLYPTISWCNSVREILNTNGS